MKRTLLLALLVQAAWGCHPDDVTSPTDRGSPVEVVTSTAAIVINGITDVDPGYGGWSEAYAINDAGQIVGWRNTQANALFSNTNFLWDPTSGTSQLFFQSDWSAGNDINVSGQVAGTHAYVGWFFDPVAGASVVAPTPASATGLVCKYGVNAINDAGVLAGSQDNCAYSQPYFWNTVSGQLGLIPVGGAFATAINNQNRVLFSTFPTAGGYAAIYDIATGGIQQLPSLAGGETRGNDMNDAGQVVGYSTVAGNTRAILWDPAEGMRDLGTLGGTASVANAINDLGQVVGWSLTATGGKHAFAWDPVSTSMQDLGTIAGDSSVAYDINDLGQATGWSTTGYGMHHAVIWDVSFAPPQNPPVADAGGPYTGTEGSPVFVDGTGSSDPDGDVLTYAWDFDGDAVPEATGPTASFTYAEDGTYTVTLTVDDGTGSSTTSVSVDIANAPPTLASLAGPLDPVSVGASITVTGSFLDPGSLDTHTASVDWGDGTLSAETAVAGGVTATHAYVGAGVYAVRVTVTDDDGGVSNEQVFEYVVVYDPDAGFVTGGGWIDSPPGAYAADPMLTGKASFGFVSKYRTGTSVPTGNTEFQFRAASLTFTATRFQWLVVSGARAQFKGEGTINGTGSYQFLLTATDGQVTGGGGTDRFRIKITDPNGGLVYDNVAGAADGITDANPQAIGGGSIMIHRR